MFNKRGISPLIATVLIIGFTVALAAIIMTWGGGFIKSIQEETEETSEESLILGTEVGLEVRKAEVSAALSQIELSIENTGSKYISSFTVRIKGADGVDSVKTDSGLEPYGIKNYILDFDSIKTGAVKEVEVIPSVTINGKNFTSSNVYDKAVVGEVDISGTCDNGNVDFGETCDDSNTASGDGCSSSCLVEDGWECPTNLCSEICGDNKVVGNEVCDGADLRDETCASQGLVRGDLECSSDCNSFDTTNCDFPSDSGLVGYWSFDDGSATDVSTNNNAGTISGASSVDDGKVGRALSFDSTDGTDDYVDIIFNPSIQLDSFTMSVWFKTTGTELMDIYHFDNALGGDTQYMNRMYVSPDHKASIYVQGSSGCGWSGREGTSDVNDGDWHHALFVVDNNWGTLYVDRFSEYSANAGVPNCDFSALPLNLGNIGKTLNNQFYFNGVIDEVAIFNRALSQEEINGLYEMYNSI